MVENLRLRAALLVRTAVTARMGQLQSNQQAVIRSRNLAMLLEKYRLQPRQTGLCMRSCQKLIRIGTPLVTDGNRFAAPNQFRPAAPESLPAANRMFAGIAVACGVPPFHGLDSEAIANLDALADDRLSQRRPWPANELVVAGYRQAQRIDMLLKLSNISNAAQTQNSARVHSAPRHGEILSAFRRKVRAPTSYLTSCSLSSAGVP